MIYSNCSVPSQLRSTLFCSCFDYSDLRDRSKLSRRALFDVITPCKYFDHISLFQGRATDFFTALIVNPCCSCGDSVGLFFIRLCTSHTLYPASGYGAEVRGYIFDSQISINGSILTSFLIKGIVKYIRIIFC